MTEDEAEQGYVLTCQMTPKSDCIIRIPATSDVAKTSVSHLHGRSSPRSTALSDTAHRVLHQAGRPVVAGLPARAVRQHPGARAPTRPGRSRSAPGRAPTRSAFLIRNTTYGVLTTYLRERAKDGDRIEFNGPLGSFYLRKIKRPVLFLAGGTGLAPFLSMLHKIEQDGGSEHPIHLIFGVTNEPGPGQGGRAGGLRRADAELHLHLLVAAEESSYPNKGYVTRHMKPEHLNDGIVDVYLCGPPPMVDAVRKYLADQGIAPASFYYEKFSGTGVVSEIGESHVKAVDSDEAFDARMALELGAAQLVVGKLSRRAARRVPAAGGGDRRTHIKDGHFTDPAGFRETNSAFHLFPIEATGNATLRRGLPQAARPGVHGPRADPVGRPGRRHHPGSPRHRRRLRARRLRGPAADHRRAQRPRQGDHAGRDREGRGARADMIFPVAFDGQGPGRHRRGAGPRGGGGHQGGPGGRRSRSGRSFGARARGQREADAARARRRSSLIADLEQYGDCAAIMAAGARTIRPDRHPDQQRRRHDLGQALRPLSAEDGDRGGDPPLAVPDPVVLPRGAAVLLVEQGGGTIVNVSSVATRGVNRVPYAAAKGGVNALTASLASSTPAGHPGRRHRARRDRGPGATIARDPEAAEDRAGKGLVPGASSTRPSTPR